VLVISKVEDRRTLDNADADGGDLADDRIGLYRAAGQQFSAGQSECDIGTRDRRTTGAAVGLYDIAVKIDLPLAKQFCIDDGPQATPDQALYLLCTARRTLRLALRTRI